MEHVPPEAALAGDLKFIILGRLNLHRRWAFADHWPCRVRVGAWAFYIPALRMKFEQWKAAHPELLSNQVAVLDFIFANCKRYVEPEWRRYPVLSVF